MPHIGIFGGSFNPIHVGHIALARILLEKTTLDEIWFVVSPRNPLKRQCDLLSDEKRLEMVRIAIKNEDRLIASDFEFHLPKPSYMLHTLQALTKNYPQNKFSLIIGADNWQLFDRWMGYQEIIDNYSIIIYPRTDCPVDSASLPPSVSIVNTPLFNISSTLIRERISKGLPLNGFVPEEIEDLSKKYYLNEIENNEI